MKYIVIFFLLVFPLFSWGQKLDLVFRGSFINVDEDKKESGYKVEVFQENKLISSSTSSSNGNFNITVGINQDSPFILKFRKSGFVTKIMSFDFDGANEEDIPTGGEFFDPFKIQVFKEKENVDFTFLETSPVASFYWNKKKLIPELDKSQQEKISNEIKILLAQHKNNNSVLDSNNQSSNFSSDADAQYKKILIVAENKILLGEYEKAIELINRAIKFKPEDIRPKRLLDKINAIQLVNNKYNNLINYGDSLLKIENYKEAKIKYNDALKLKPNETEPKIKIKQVNDLISQILNSNKNNILYYDYLDKANKKNKLKEYQSALVYYNKALSIKPNDTLVQSKILNIENILKNDLTFEKKDTIKFNKWKPITIQSLDLKELGDPLYDNSIIAGGGLIQKSSSDRFYMKSSKLRRKKTFINKEETDRILSEIKSNYSKSNQINLAKNLMVSSGGDSDFNRQLQLTINSLRKAQIALEIKDRIKINFENGESLAAQTTLDSIKQESILDYSQRNNKHTDNMDIMASYNTAQAKLMSNDILNNHDKNIKSNQNISFMRSLSEKLDDNNQNSQENNALINSLAYELASENNDDYNIQKFKYIQNQSFIDNEMEILENEMLSRLNDKENSISILKEIDDKVKKMDARKIEIEMSQNYNVSSEISNVNNLPKDQFKVPNSLGKEYPEGVSQESFSRSDNNGLVTTIITRRIVVVNGHADVYIRTQTLNGITYTKNGKPSLNHVWQKETQAAHLERHF
ncbi:MAG: hypothetical protein CL844_01255 [Crocinitomicaceae bacterium]|nr:hypothetical protein [Crocinitomicaceae bacterium]|tara:strand:+ start:8736 stop:10985 length:2250 start_codon:yes stop_codon:yes gene_type:complete